MKLRPGDRAVVTGASHGIGQAFARQLAARGVDLVLLARSENRLHALAAELSQVHCTVLPCDLRLGLPSEQDLGRIDLLVNNAGFGLFAPFETNELDWITGMIDVNVRAVAALARLVVPQMVERARGGILNVSSTAAFQPMAYLAVYAASKTFVLNFSQALHAEYAARGITVTALCPGVTDTRFHGIAQTPRLPRFMEQSPEQVAAIGLRAIEAGRSTVVSGLFNKLGAALADVTPGFISSGFVARAMRPLAGRGDR